jgi:TatD DNase family protein
VEYVDTHCHIHDSEFAEKNELTSEEILKRAKAEGVNKLICVGTSLKSSQEAKIFAQKNEGCYYSVALHPHEAENYSIEDLKKQINNLEKLIEKDQTKFVAVGECGLDYFYHQEKSALKKQKEIFRLQIELAIKYNKPLIFHIRSSENIDRDDNNISDAFIDFFNIIDEYKNIRGVVHSFSATPVELEGVLKRGLYVGLNGIMTFTKDEKQLDAAKNVPIEKLLLETDAPFLTPKPFRGTINEPKYVINITKFLSELRDDSQAYLAKQTTKNAKQLFNL